MIIPDYVPDDLDPGEITICDNCGMVTTWPTGYATEERCRDCAEQESAGRNRWAA